MEDTFVKFYQEGLSIREISKRSLSVVGRKCSTDFISKILKSKGIQFRTRSEEVTKAMSQLDINRSFLTEDIVEWIDGLMLGDGGISFGENYKGARICIASSQKEWANYGMKGLSVYHPSEAKISGKISKKSPNPIWASRTLWHPDIATQAKRWYPCGSKKNRIPLDIKITKTSVLLWYLGDGSITNTDKNSTFVRFATCSFNKDDIDNILIPRLKYLGISSHRDISKNDICIDTNSIPVFFEFIGELSPIPCYQYKFQIPEWRKKIRLKEIFPSKEDRWRAMYYIKENKVSSSRSPGGRIVLLNDNEASKLKELVLPSGIKLKDIIETKEDFWRARSLIASGEIKANRSVLTKEEASKLKEILHQHRGGSIVPSERIDREFQEIRQKGFPYYKFDSISLDRIKQQLNDYIPNKPYLWHGKNTELASFFFPHIFMCKRKNKMSALELFNNDDLLKDVINKVICLYGKTTEANVRQMCRNHHLSSRINNFPPRVAKTIIQEISKGAPIEILDPCCGFGGRVLGAMSCSNVISYTGIDLSLPTYIGNTELIKRLGFSYRAIVHHGDCLNFDLGGKRFNLILTSPPFFDVEEYIGVETFKDYELWKLKFAKPFISFVKEHLSKDGKAAFYLDEIRNKNFIEDFNNISLEAGLIKEPSIFFNFPSNEYNRSENTSKQVEVQVFSLPK